MPSFVGMVHVDVSEGDVVDDTAADGSDGQSYTTSIDPLKQHVFRVVLNLVYKKYKNSENMMFDRINVEITIGSMAKASSTTFPETASCRYNSVSGCCHNVSECMSSTFQV